MAALSNTMPSAADRQATTALQLGGVNPEARRKALADSIINTHYFPPHFTTIRLLAYEALAYHNLRPYPYWAFGEWKTEERGILPRCLPIARRIVTRSAKWLFGNPVEIHMPKSETGEKFFREAWQLNRMPARMVAATERAGVEGGVVLKWSYDEKDEVPLRFQVLSPISDCRLFYDPHDSDRLMMARIQYPVFNPGDGNYYLYREEWTDDREVHYLPQKMTYANLYRVTGEGMANPFAIADVPVIANSKQEPDLYDKWEIQSQGPNKFGIIPVHLIRNAEALAWYGRGDLWTDVTGGMFRLMDRINLTYHGMDRNNQLYADPTMIYIDAKAGPDVLDRPLQPGQPVSLKSDDGMSPNGGKQAQAVPVEFDGNMRPHMRDYAQDLKRELLDTVGSVDVDTSEVGNKGNLTDAVLTQLWLPLIQTTEEKRKTYGEDGIAKFLERVACGLANLGAKEAKGIDSRTKDTYDVRLKWPDFFPMDDEEKQARFTRLSAEVDGGYLPLENAVEAVLQMEGVEDIPGAKKQLEGVHDQKEREREAQVQTAEGQAKQAQNPPESGKAGIGAKWRSKSGN